MELSDPTVQTYGDVAFHVWGAPGRLLTDASLMLTQFGFCVGYMVFLSEWRGRACACLRWLTHRPFTGVQVKTLWPCFRK